MAIVAAPRLLREGFASRLEQWAGSTTAEVERHEETMGTGEAEDVCFAHLESCSA